jgi:translation initiation factor IF-3
LHYSCIEDFGKWRYREEQLAKSERRTARRLLPTTKEIHLRVGTNAHDVETKAHQAREFLRANMSVRIAVTFDAPTERLLAIDALRRSISIVESEASGQLPAQETANEVVAVLWSA